MDDWLTFGGLGICYASFVLALIIIWKYASSMVCSQSTNDPCRSLIGLIKRSGIAILGEALGLALFIVGLVLRSN